MDNRSLTQATLCHVEPPLPHLPVSTYVPSPSHPRGSPQFAWRDHTARNSAIPEQRTLYHQPTFLHLSSTTHTQSPQSLYTPSLICITGACATEPQNLYP